VLVCFFFLLIIFTDSVQIGAEEGANTIFFFSRPTIHAHYKERAIFFESFKTPKNTRTRPKGIFKNSFKGEWIMRVIKKNLFFVKSIFLDGRTKI